MNGRIDDERLSAWIDGELSPQERAEFERLLNESAEVRAQIDELRQISTAVRSLDRVSAPPDLKQAVLDAIHRPQPDRAVGGTRRFGRRNRMLPRLVAGVAAVAVVAVTAVWFGGRDRSVAVNPDPAPERISISRGPNRSLANQAARRGPAFQTDSALQAGTVRQPLLEIRPEDLTEARIGDIVEAVESNGDGVSVIRLTVVDRHAGIDALRVVLARQELPVRNGANAAAETSGLVAVFVESDSDRLSRALAGMRDELAFESLSVSPPVPVAQIGEEARQELGLGGEATSDGPRAVQVRPSAGLTELLNRPVDGSASPGTADAAPVRAVPRGSTPAGKARSPVRVIILVSDAALPAAPAGDNGAS